MAKVIDFCEKVIYDPKANRLVVASKENVRRLVNQARLQIFFTLSKGQAHPYS
ncbi:MAG: hypothetical protein N2491_01815 [Negativicutes bacterium]|nr:hypothetical protein [Negativicutes bacterium]